MVNSDNVTTEYVESPLKDAVPIGISDHIRIEEIDDEGECQKVILTKRG